MGVLGKVRIIEAFYVGFVLLNGLTTAVMVLGPASWWLILLLVAPMLISAQISTLITRDFSLMWAVCQPSAETMMAVEHDSVVLQRACVELQAEFRQMFISANVQVRAPQP